MERESTVSPNPWLALVAAALAVMMVAVDGTVVGAANPTIARDLDASLAGLQWVTNGYLLALAVLLIIGGKLGDRFGRKRMLIVGILGFALTSLGCALSPSIGALVVFRVLQGVAGALLMPNTLAVLRAAFPADELNRAVGIWGGSIALATASGPIVGGLLVEHVSWQSIFLLNLPLGALAAFLTWRWATETRDTAHVRSFDLPGVGLLAGGLFALIWAIIKAQDRGWTSAYVLGFGALAAVLLVAFVARERRAAEPLLPLDLFRSRALSAGTALIVIGFFSLFGVLFFIGLYLQNVLDYSPVATGVRLLPLTAMMTVSSPLGGWLTERYGPRPPLVGGMLLIAGSLLALTRLDADTPYSQQWPCYLALGLAMGIVIVASTQAIVGNAPVERGGIAGGLQATANQLGGVLGTAVLGSIIVSGVGSSLGGALAANGVPADVAARVEGQEELVAQGVAPVTGSMSDEVARAVTDASVSAFLDGLHTALYVGVALSLISAALALLVGRGRAVEGVEAVAAA